MTTEVNKASTTGTSTNAYVTAVHGNGRSDKKTVIIGNTDATNPLKYRIKGYAVGGSALYSDIQTEETIAHGDYADHFISNFFDIVEIEVKNGNADTPGYHKSGLNPMLDLTGQEVAGYHEGAAGPSVDLTGLQTAGFHTSGVNPDTNISALQTVGYHTSDAAPATDLSVLATAGTHESGANPALDLSALQVAGYHTSGQNPALDLASLKTAGYHTSGASPSENLSILQTAGYHTSDLNPYIDLSHGTDCKFNIQNDSEAGPSLVTLDPAACQDGASTAAEMQLKIRALGGAYAAVTVTYNGTGPTDYYVITSGTVGSGSSVTITDAVADNCADDLLIAAANGGTSTAGIDEGDFEIQADTEAASSTVTIDLTACTTGLLTAAEIEGVIQTLGGAYASATCAFTDGRYVITSGTVGSDSAIIITNGSTFNVADDLKIAVANGGTSTQGIGTADFKIYADVAGGSAQTVSLDIDQCTTGADTAAEMQTKIRALAFGHPYDHITVAYVGAPVTDTYVITSETVGANSQITITDGTTNNAAVLLKIGAANGGTSTQGISKTDFKIQADTEAAASTVSLDWSACTTGLLTAAEMQTKIQALAGAYASVTVSYVGAPVTDTYLITSGTTGNSSRILITDATSNNCADSLKIAVANGGTSTTGNSDGCFNIQVDAEAAPSLVTLDVLSCTDGAATAAEMESKIQALAGAYAAVTVAWGAVYTIRSGTVGSASQVLITDAVSDNVADDLKIAVANGGVSTAGVGTGTFKIQCDSEMAASTVTLDMSACTTGPMTATEMQTKIQALAGAYAAVTVAHNGTAPTNTFVITSGTVGSGSAVTITDGVTNNLADDLNIAVANGGASTAGIGTGNFNIQVDAEAVASAVAIRFSLCTDGAATAAELETRIQALGGNYASVTAVYDTDHYLITSGTTGAASKVLITNGAAINVADDLKIATANGGTSVTGISTGSFAIQADTEAVASQVNLVLASCTDGAATAAEMQSKIRAIGAPYDNCLVTYTGTPVTDYYTITSELPGTLSKIRITNGTVNNVADHLEIGTANGGTDTDGTTPTATYQVDYICGA